MKQILKKQIWDYQYIMDVDNNNFRVGKKPKDSDVYDYSDTKPMEILAIIFNRLID